MLNNVTNTYWQHLSLHFSFLYSTVVIFGEMATSLSLEFRRKVCGWMVPLECYSIVVSYDISESP